jgi:hypothetical protein
MSDVVDVHMRTAYSAFDFMGDVGGLAEALVYLFQMILYVNTYMQLRVYLVTEIFKIQAPCQSVAPDSVSISANPDAQDLKSKALATINERSKIDRKFRHLPLLKRIF